MYSFDIVKFSEVYEKELEPLLKEAYETMAKREQKLGMPKKEFKPTICMYERANIEGWLLVYLLRKDGKAIGFATVYLSQDNHTEELYASEDLVYVVEKERNGIGKELLEFVQNDLKKRGVAYVMSYVPVAKEKNGFSESLGFIKIANIMKKYL